MILIPIAILALVGTAGIVQSKRAKAAADPNLQAQHKVVYETAINTVKDPAKLRSLAGTFRESGLIAEADMLEKRAALQERSPEQKEAERAVFRKAMKSTNVEGILGIADAFESQGQTSAAKNLRTYAAGLTSASEAAAPQSTEATNEQA